MARRIGSPSLVSALGWVVALSALAIWPATGLLRTTVQQVPVGAAASSSFILDFSYASQTIVITSVISTAGGIILGLLLGSASGIGPRWLARGTAALEGVWTLIPPILIVMIVALAYGRSFSVVIPAIAAVTWPLVSVPLRTAIIAFRQSEVHTAARITGLTRSDLLWREVWPGLRPVLLLAATRCLAIAVTLDVAVNLVLPGNPDPTWGGMIAQALSAPEPDPQGVILPLGAFCLTLFSLARIGHDLNRLSDPVPR